MLVLAVHAKYKVYVLGMGKGSFVLFIVCLIMYSSGRSPVQCCDAIELNNLFIELEKGAVDADGSRGCHRPQ